MTQYEKDRQKAQEWAAMCWPLPGKSDEQTVHNELARQIFMQGYERRLQEERRRAMDKREGS
jgi:hypothetical protein